MTVGSIAPGWPSGIAYGSAASSSPSSGALNRRAELGSRHSRATLRLQERICSTFLADGRLRPVARIDTCIVSKRKEHVANRRDERRIVAAREIGPANGAGEQRVADEQILAGFAR